MLDKHSENVLILLKGQNSALDDISSTANQNGYPVRFNEIGLPEEDCFMDSLRFLSD